MLRLVFAFIVLLAYVGSMDDVHLLVSELNGLSELPLEKLLQVKNNLEQDTSSLEVAESRSDGEDISVSLDTSEAQALQGKMKKPHQRGSYETSWQKKGGGKKGLSTIFQISITALAFLAFGGYLLCLLMQAIKAKQTTTTMATTNPMVMLNAPFRRRKPDNTRLRRQAVWPEADPDALYYALKMFSEGFATYHTVDYKYYNFTADSLG